MQNNVYLHNHKCQMNPVWDSWTWNRLVIVSFPFVLFVCLFLFLSKCINRLHHNQAQICRMFFSTNNITHTHTHTHTRILTLIDNFYFWKKPVHEDNQAGKKCKNWINKCHFHFLFVSYDFSFWPRILWRTTAPRSQRCKMRKTNKLFSLTGKF